MKIKNWIKHYYSMIVLYCFSAVVYAQKIEKPDYVNDINADALQDAGAALGLWIFAFIAVVISLSALVPAYLFATGNSDDGWKWTKNILIGGAIASVLGAVVFGVIAVFN